MSLASPCSQAPARWLMLSVDASNRELLRTHPELEDCLLSFQRELRRRALQAAWIVGCEGDQAGGELPSGERIVSLSPTLASEKAARESLGMAIQKAQEHHPGDVLRAVAVTGTWASPHGDLLVRRGIQAVVTLPQPLSWPARLLRRGAAGTDTGALQVLRYGLRRLPVTHLVPRQVSAFAHLARRKRDQYRYLHLLVPAEALLSGRGAQAVTLALELAQELVHRHLWCCVTPGELLSILDTQSQRQGATSILRRAA